MAITPTICRAARTLLGWKQSDLAEKSGVSIGTVKAFETGKTDPIPATLTVLQQALAADGVIFIDENGYRAI